MAPNGWNIRHRVGVQYTGDGSVWSNNALMSSATAGSLDDTSNSGSALLLNTSGVLQYVTASAGANPRTFTTRWTADANGDFTLSTGNFIQGTAAKGVNFTANTPAAGMTSQLLNWYEEGVITIAATCDTGTITLSNNTLYYTRIGRSVTVNGQLTVSSVSSPSGNVYFGLPIQAATNSTVTIYLSGTNTIAGEIPVGLINAGQTIFYVQKLNQLAGTISGAAAIFKAGTQLNFQATYTV